MALFHFSNYRTFEEAMIGFTAYCREHDLRIGLSHSQEALIAAQQGFSTDKQTLKYTLNRFFALVKKSMLLLKNALRLTGVKESTTMRIR